MKDSPGEVKKGVCVKGGGGVRDSPGAVSVF